MAAQFKYIDSNYHWLAILLIAGIPVLINIVIAIYFFIQVRRPITRKPTKKEIESAVILAEKRRKEPTSYDTIMTTATANQRTMKPAALSQEMATALEKEISEEKVTTSMKNENRIFPSKSEVPPSSILSEVKQAEDDDPAPAQDYEQLGG